jgi:hypothetical protein
MPLDLFNQTALEKHLSFFDVRGIRRPQTKEAGRNTDTTKMFLFYPNLS